MSTKYKTSRWSCRIESVEVQRETDQSVWVNGRRQAKNGASYHYYDSWNEARSALLASTERRVMSARRALEIANSELGNVKGMKEPGAKE